MLTLFESFATATQVLLDAMVEHKVGSLVYSSTAAVYGNSLRVAIDETHPKMPMNPYGRSKLMAEQILADHDQAWRLRTIALRYFNPAWNDSEATLGERHSPETHLIPLVLQAGLGKRGGITVYGTDYETVDGACVSDYIHVEDLCAAHLLTLQALRGE
jgi:UDP-glucose 4-epimerase